MDDREPFLSRWSRRKLEAKEHTPEALPAAAAPAASSMSATGPVSPESPPGLGADYREFFDPNVEETLRRAALKKLFSDPHFKVMDGLDTYIDDYSAADPIPAAMLRRLNQAKELFLFDDENKAAAGAGAAATPGGAAAGVPAAAAGTAALPEAPPASASDQDAEAGTGAAAAAPADRVKKNC